MLKTILDLKQVPSLPKAQIEPIIDKFNQLSITDNYYSRSVKDILCIIQNYVTYGIPYHRLLLCRKIANQLIGISDKKDYSTKFEYYIDQYGDFIPPICTIMVFSMCAFVTYKMLIT